MNTKNLLEALGYENNPAFLQGKKLEEHYGYSFFFSQASQNIDKSTRGCNLKGVYRILDSSDDSKGNFITPVVYVCEAANENEASKIHKRVWNQNIVPFLFVVTPQNIRLYSGFDYGDKNDKRQTQEIAKNDNEILVKFSAITAQAIDSGQIWEQKEISTTKRVDKHLLLNLKKLSSVLTGRHKLPIEIAHCLIGKYIYLKYLRDRGILSDSKFTEAGVTKDDIFSGNAHKNKLYQLEIFLNDFLNGSVFPLPDEKDIKTEHIREVVRAFEGGDPKSGQKVLFDMYDFSCIPIETLSVVYQQFLYQKGDTKKKGAYYTPVHLVNFVLEELNAKKPLKKGMKVFDPSCGSGAFLVQCYRRLVESVLRGENKTLNPSDLRDILTKNIFGLDADKEACQVAQLSLSLTLLDYIDPPDLTKTNFKLPDLGKSNIFHCEGGFFDKDSPWVKFIGRQKPEETKYNWIVGNPPWKNIGKKKELYDEKAIEWINANKHLYPVDNYQVAEAFAWKATEVLDEKGQCGLLMPAKTLFKKQGKHFRAKFFSEKETWRIVNFSNIRRYLFEKAINPAAAFFFSGRKNWNKTEHYITTYAPFAVEQSSQLNQKGRSKKLWSIFVNYSSIKDIPLKDIANGSAEPWKIAMWGTQRDKNLISFISKKYENILAFKENNALAMGQGSEFESLPVDADTETIKKFKALHKPYPDYIGQETIITDNIPENCMSLPQEGIYRKLGVNDVYLRLRGGEAGLDLFKSPHILISSSRKFAVYADNKDFIVPTRQIGIAGNNSQRNLLKALALYLNSDFVNYHQWLISASWGIERDNSNFDDLKRLPIPLSKLLTNDLDEWAKLHDNIAEAYQKKDEKLTRFELLDLGNGLNDIPDSLKTLLKKMNKKVYDLLGINRKQQWSIGDMLHTRMKLNDGKIAKEATTQATEDEIKEFANIFQNELDLFLDETGKKKIHKIKILYTNNTVAMIIEHLQKSGAGDPEILEVKDNKTKQGFDDIQAKLTEHRSQWIYYTRCLKIYEGRRTYIFKPRQRLYWLKSQALVEADDFLSEKIRGE